jgi:2-oxoglutarate ferredoxin oxidoreductase subunit beta
MNKSYSRPGSLRDVPTHYCSGCGHGIVHRIIAEVIDEFNIREDTIGICPVGCAVIAYNYWNFDCCEAAHGRALAVATGIKRIQPGKIVFTYQGDGDLAAIGTAETIHAANRGENLTTVFINNAVYGMTGGQMAPTTVLNQKTATTPLGRDYKYDGYPLKISEMLAMLEGCTYAERVAVNSPKNIIKTKQAIRQGFKNQIEGKGFSLVEVLSSCPTYWRMSAVEAGRWIEEKLTKIFPLGIIK